MNSLKFLFKKYKLEEVFTPSSYAKLTYVSRPSLEDDVEKFLKIPGMQIVLYGHSGCGKSTMIYNILQKRRRGYISTSCTSSTTFDELLYQAFDKLNVFYKTEMSSSRSDSYAAELKLKNSALSSMLSQTTIEGASEKQVRVLPLQLTPERLAQFLGEMKCVWVIEDFHKVAEKEKKRLAEVVKIFMDSASTYPYVKIICLGAVTTANELVALDNDLATRVAEIFIPLMLDIELSKVIETGFELLNLVYDKLLEDKIIYYSNNLAAVCHQLCFDICHSLSIENSQIQRMHVNDDNFDSAVLSYLKKNSDTIKKPFDRIASNPRCVAILEGMINIQNETMTIGEILTETKKIINIHQEELLILIEEMKKPELGEVIRFDTNSKKYSFATPFFQAFLKMQIESEKMERNEQENRRNRKDQYQLVRKPELFNACEIIRGEEIEEYIQTLNSYFLRSQKLKEEFDLLQQ